MPSLSPTMQRGTIVKWYKQEGEMDFFTYRSDGYRYREMPMLLGN